ncbi:unnamed protein product [Dibothriocephalus latus]|uniref:Uncharacterized protein n=1 Tax=Dibothriocephalus latus TaxID=60516 RepID=A0A3P7M548_DIBLA|nr:unnamed protein product [Dibothriocephalus latus]
MGWFPVDNDVLEERTDAFFADVFATALMHLRGIMALKLSFYAVSGT